MTDCLYRPRTHDCPRCGYDAVCTTRQDALDSYARSARRERLRQNVKDTFMCALPLISVALPALALVIVLNT